MANPAALLAENAAGPRSWLRALGRGLAGRCPQCGAGKLFAGYTRTRAACDACGLNISGHRADDAPPYVTIFLVGHIMIPLAMLVKQAFDPALGLQFLIFTPMAAALAAWLLPVSKGGFIGLQWANRMHGFGGAGDTQDA